MVESELGPGEQLQIQMAYAVPLLKRLQDIIGKDVVLDALREDTRRRTEKAAAKSDWARAAAGFTICPAEARNDSGSIIRFRLLNDIPSILL